MPLKPHHHRLDAGDPAIGANVSDTISVAVFDESALFRAGIVHVLDAELDMRVVAVSDIPSLLGLSVDIVIIDSALIARHRSLTQTIQGFRWSTKVLVLAFGLDEEQVFAAFAAGARGYVLKGVSGPELLAAVRALHRGEGYVSPSVGALLVSHASRARRGKPAGKGLLPQLTFREAQIFNLLTSGLTNREIGCRLEVTEKTVKRYLTGIFEKLNVRNRVEAVMLSRQRRENSGAHAVRPGISISDASIPPPRLDEASAAVRSATVSPTADVLLRSNGHSANGHSLRRDRPD